MYIACVGYIGVPWSNTQGPVHNVHCVPGTLCVCIVDMCVDIHPSGVRQPQLPHRQETAVLLRALQRPNSVMRLNPRNSQRSYYCAYVLPPE